MRVGVLYRCERHRDRISSRDEYRAGNPPREARKAKEVHNTNTGGI